MASAAVKSSPIRFIGHFDLVAEGKFLFEILCQLRNLGVGRYVTKNEWAMKWPNQSSYLKIVKARPEMDRWMARGRVWAEWTLRGRDLGLYEFSDDLNRSDWKLIHKHEESRYRNCKEQMPILEVPSTFPLPALQIYLSKQQAAKSGRQWSEADERAPLQVVIDPQHEHLRQFVRQVEPKQKATNIYDEVLAEDYLDWYGELLPPKVEAWNTGPAYSNWHWKPTSISEDVL